jgi:hypothetical protein
MTTPDADGLIRVGGARYGQPFRSDGSGLYKPGTWLVAVYESDDRYVTKACRRVLDAWGIQ